MDRPDNVPAARRRKIRHRNPLLPTRPVKAPTVYTQFLKHYFTEQNTAEPRTLRTAAVAWNALTPDEKARYAVNIEAAQADYRRQIDAWKKIRDALRKPPTAYGLYIQQRWTAIRAQGGVLPNVQVVGREASRRWANMPNARKNLYIVAREHLMFRYRQHILGIQQGNPIQQDWLATALAETELGHRQMEGTADDDDGEDVAEFVDVEVAEDNEELDDDEEEVAEDDDELDDDEEVAEDDDEEVGEDNEELEAEEEFDDEEAEE